MESNHNLPVFTRMRYPYAKASVFLVTKKAF